MNKKIVLVGLLTVSLFLISGFISVQAEDPVDKYALIIGISDYKAISDLNYCDEDATDWYNYLSTKGYQITLLGDNHPENYPQWDGLATEYNVKQAWATILDNADENDIVAFISSGHGSQVKVGRGRTAYYAQLLCMWDHGAGENGENGYILDSEFQDMMAPAVSNVFIFLDHCFSGGMNEVMLNPNADKIYLTTTCTDAGYGYDVPAYNNGAWTYYFLEYTLIGQFGGTASMEETFASASAIYPFTRKDTPMQFDGNPSVAFYL